MQYDHIKVGERLVLLSDIKEIELSQLTTEVINVHLIDNTVEQATGFAALELIWLLKPSALEGNPGIRWKKHMWAFHNLFAHPVMQLLAWCRLYKQAIWLHDITVPKPIGYKNDRH